MSDGSSLLTAMMRQIQAENPMLFYAIFLAGFICGFVLSFVLALMVGLVR